MCVCICLYFLLLFDFLAHLLLFSTCLLQWCCCCWFCFLRVAAKQPSSTHVTLHEPTMILRNLLAVIVSRSIVLLSVSHTITIARCCSLLLIGFEFYNFYPWIYLKNANKNFYAQKSGFEGEKQQNFSAIKNGWRTSNDRCQSIFIDVQHACVCMCVCVYGFVSGNK